MGSTSNRKKLQQLYIKSKKKCKYCGRKTEMPPTDGVTTFKRMATQEHLYSKMDIRRLLSNKTVLCCLECNQNKAYADYDAIFNNEFYNNREYNDLFQTGNGLLRHIYMGRLWQLT